MKLINKLVFVFWIAFLPAIARCQTNTQKAQVAVKIITSDDDGNKLTFLKGEFFTLRLKDHLDGGFVLNKPQFDSLILTLYKHSPNKPRLNGPLGASGTDSWLFRAIKSGKTSLKVTSTRPWMTKDSVLTFSNEVIIK
jgi:predicted secreted protein